MRCSHEHMNVVACSHVNSCVVHIMCDQARLQYQAGTVGSSLVVMLSAGEMS